MFFRPNCMRNTSVLGLSLAITLFLFVTPSISATFNAQTFFKYLDQSCTSSEKLADLNNAGDDMNALISAAKDTFDSWNTLRVKTFSAFFGQTNEDQIADASTLLQCKFFLLMITSKKGITL